MWTTGKNDYLETKYRYIYNTKNKIFICTFKSYFYLTANNKNYIKLYIFIYKIIYIYLVFPLLRYLRKSLFDPIRDMCVRVRSFNFSRKHVQTFTQCSNAAKYGTVKWKEVMSGTFFSRGLVDWLDGIYHSMDRGMYICLDEVQYERQWIKGQKHRKKGMRRYPDEVTLW